jgi:hypothetical protein
VGPPVSRGANGRRLLLLAVAVLLSLAAALAIGILLFGDFGATEGRILATTAMLAAFGLVAVPGAILRDRRRLSGLAAALAALAVLGAALSAILIWGGEPPDLLGRAWGTTIFWLAAALQTAALALRRSARDPSSVHRLFLVATVIVVVLAAALTAVVWAEISSPTLGRAVGALLVLDVLLVALQPILARARPPRESYRVRLLFAEGVPAELELEAVDRAAAAAQAIRHVAPRVVAQLEFDALRAPEATATPPPARRETLPV